LQPSPAASRVSLSLGVGPFLQWGCSTTKLFGQLLSHDRWIELDLRDGCLHEP